MNLPAPVGIVCYETMQGELMSQSSTFFEKLWKAHVVREHAGQPALLYIDLHLVHEVTSPQAFDGLRANGYRVRRPGRTVATVDHNVPTRSHRSDRRSHCCQAD